LQPVHSEHHALTATKLPAQRTILGDLLHHPSAGGAVLALAAVIAIIIANSPLAWMSERLLDTPLVVKIGTFGIDKPLLLWINDGLMAIFFFQVGLEIKKELLIGSLSSRERAALPLIGAIGGMAVPALIYTAINFGDPVALRGWAIPAATDIAFAIGVLTLLGNRVPASLKAFLLALAIIDDLGAIIIIALFYTSELSMPALLAAALGIGILVLLNRLRIGRFAPYLLTGIFIWLFVLKSGVHATLAGVIVALSIPVRTDDPAHPAMADELMESLHPWVTFAILPLFAFANAGISFTGMTVASLVQPIPLGIAAGLIVGKAVGVYGSARLAVAAGIAELPAGATWDQVLGVAMLCGIGFTMSLFIGMLAFPDPAYAAPLRLGVLTGSLISAIAGYVWLARSRQPAPSQPVS
jgi:NhaA family Na+:H+ antiporter